MSLHVRPHVGDTSDVEGKGPGYEIEVVYQQKHSETIIASPKN